MKKLTIITIILLLTLCASFALAKPKKANLGPCVRDCVRAFNPSLADSDAEQFLLTDFNAEICVAYCKEEITSEEPCLYTEDDCCNTDFEKIDPDCNGPSLPGSGAECDPAEGCKEGFRCVSCNPFGTGDPYTCN